MFVNIILFVVFLLIIFYLWINYNHGYWKRKNIPGPKPTFFFGHFTLENNMGMNFANIYNEYKTYPFVGIFLMFKKTLLINDLDLIKNVLIKDQHYFLGHGFTFEANSDPLTQHLFNLEGEEWKTMRVKLTPTFTSSKMKMMYQTMYLCTEEMIKYMDNYAISGKHVDFKEIVGKLGTDIIASCAFGIQSNSFKDENAEFRRMGRKILQLSPKRVLTFIGSLVSPKLVDLLTKERFPKDISSFFYRVVRETVEYRETNNVRRNDFLQLLIDMKNDHTKPEDSLTMTEITAQVFVFFIAGFETSATTSSFALLELSRNPDIMEKVVAEIDQAFESDGGKITYESLSKMTYLTQVINETLRMYPPLPFLLRRCTTEYKVPGMNTVIEKGTMIAIPSLGIHRDPNIYPDPTKFDPERFTAENIRNRPPCTHLPFGEGPRICIGARFGVMQVKLALVMTLRNYNVELKSKVPKVVKFKPRHVALQSENEIFLKTTHRKH